ncbi:DMT family transporter [Stutzerimonas tarimensis]|uniref:DMT family transporter n=1 Tax=Stutzerimonas tarimensis TaxID=1507735 RepID=A0ABV7T0B4_9GAMM
MNNPDICVAQPAPARAFPWLAWAGLLTAVLCWSGNALVARAFHEAIPPFALAFWRWSLALVILLPLAGVNVWRHRAAFRRAGWRLLVLALFAITSFNTLLYLAAQSTEAINISLLNTCLPLVAFIGTGVLLGEWPARRAWLGLLVAAVGLLYLISQGSWARLASLQFFAGDLIMLLAISLWALYTVLLRRWHGYLEMPTLALLCVLIALGLPFLLPLYLLELARTGGFETSPANLGAIAYTAVFASLLAYLGWNRGVRAVGAAKASMTNYLMPLFTAILGWMLLEESLQAFHWIGGGFILLGLLLTSKLAGR